MKKSNSYEAASHTAENPSAVGVAATIVCQNRLQVWLLKVDKKLLVIGILPLFLLILDRSWLFTYASFAYLDPWVYFGYFQRLPQYLQIFPGAYYGDRLSWIIPGYLAYKAFPPILAAYVLHLTFYYSAVVSLYLILKHTVSERAGLFAALLLGSQSYFLWAIGWDYVDGAGLTYYLLSLLMLTYAAKSKRLWFWSIAAGICYGAMVHSQFFLVTFTPCLLFYLWRANQGFRQFSIARSVAGFVAGALAVTILLGSISYMLGGPFVFFRRSIQTAQSLVGSGNIWLANSYAWLRTAVWLVLPAVATFCAGLHFARSAHLRSQKFVATFARLFLLCAALMIACQLWRQPVLQYSYYACFLLPAAILAIAAPMGAALDGLKPRSFRILIAFIVLALVIPYAIPKSWRPQSFVPESVTSPFPTFMVLPLVLGITAALAFALKKMSRWQVLGVVLIAAGSMSVSVAGAPRFWSADPQFQKDAFPAFIQVERAVENLAPRADVLFWFDKRDPFAGIAGAVISSYLWEYRLFGVNFPSLHGKPQRQPEPYMRLLILSNDADPRRQADEAFRTAGFRAQLVAETRAGHGQISYKLTLIDVLPLSELFPDVQLDSDLWIKKITPVWGPYKDLRLDLKNARVQQLFRSDMQSTAEWYVNRYGHSGGLESKSQECLRPSDVCAVYASGEEGDHLASEFADIPRNANLAFFSIWVKAADTTRMPRLYLQNEGWQILASGTEMASRADGWRLIGNFAELKNSKKLRLAIVQPRDSSSILDKASLVVFRSDTIVPATSSRGIR